jgi:hypothetical protein
MTAAPRFLSPVRVSQPEHGASPMKNPAFSSGRAGAGARGDDHKSASRRWFRALLWRAFPSPSEGDLADKAARVLDVSPRQVTNWLRCEHDAGLSYVTAVMAVAGAEVVFGQIAPRRDGKKDS